MSDFVESLKRLFQKNVLKIEQLNKLLSEKKISQEEFIYITK
jgi:hypothetical protein